MREVSKTAISGSRYSLGFAIKVATDKYLDHLPLARQSRILKRHGVVVTTQTLWGLLEALARRLQPIDAALLERALADPVIGLDQTSWKRLDDKKKKPWQIWCVTAAGVVVHRIRGDKEAATFRKLVGDYTGTIVCDAAKRHEAGARDCSGIVPCGCWAHVFRRFKEAAADHPRSSFPGRWPRSPAPPSELGLAPHFQAPSTRGRQSTYRKRRRQDATAAALEATDGARPPRPARSCRA